MTGDEKLREAARELLLVIEPNSFHWPKSEVERAAVALLSSALEAARQESFEEAARYVDDHFSNQWTTDICDGIRALASRAAGEGKL